METRVLKTFALLLAALFVGAGCGDKADETTRSGSPTSHAIQPEKRPSPAPSSGGAPGVSADSVVFGQTAAFTGHAGSLGKELWRGAQAYFDKINEQGGVHGRKITIKPYDDQYDPDQTVGNTIKLIKEDKVFGFFGTVGTPTIVKMLPILRKFQSENIFLFTNFTGAQAQRKDPYKSFVFNLRASYNQETAGLVKHFVGNGKRSVGIFIQNDAYGRSGADGVTAGLRELGLKVVGEATYERGQRFDSSMNKQVELLKKAGADAIVSVGAYEACAAFIRDARVAGWKVPIANVSFVGPEAMLDLLLDYEKESGIKITSKLIGSQVVPSYEDQALPAVSEYRQLMAEKNPQLPPELRDDTIPKYEYSFGSLEGFLNAKVLVQALEQAGSNLTRASFKAAVENLKGVDIGIGIPVSYSADRHQGLDEVFFTTVKDGRYVPVTNWADEL